MATDRNCIMNGHIESNSNEKEKEWSIKTSSKALGTINPIRNIVEGLNLNPNPEKTFIPLSIGKRFEMVSNSNLLVVAQIA